MSKTQAERIIVISLIVFLASTVGGHLYSDQPKPERQKDFGRKMVSGFFAMMFASLLAEAAPEIGALLALSIGTYVFLHDGLPAINKGFSETKQKKATRPTGPEVKIEPATVAESLPEQRLI